MKLWKEENQVRQARPASEVIAKILRGLAPPALPWLLLWKTTLHGRTSLDGFDVPVTPHQIVSRDRMPMVT